MLDQRKIFFSKFHYCFKIFLYSVGIISKNSPVPSKKYKFSDEGKKVFHSKIL